MNNDNNSFIFSGSTIPNGGVANWCWDFGDGSTATGQTVTHSYAQIGNPQVCLTITDNCGCTRTVCQNVAYETCHCAEQSLILTPGIQYYSGPDLVGQDIIVPPGTHLIISGRTLSIKNSCKFVVLRGASLVVDNSTLTNYCNDQKWQGIVVWGNSTVPHQGHTNIPQSSASDPGIAVIQGNSHINYARTALEPQRWWSDSRNNAFFAAYPGSITNYWGGIVIGKGGSEFLNNRKSADIGTYPYTNLSSFTDCTFNSSTSDPGNGTGAEGVNIWNTNGVTFTQCNFNSIPARGITTINAAITVTKSLFTKNYQGILAGTTSTFTAITRIGTGTLTDQNTFTENKFGVSADAASLLQIWTNIFSKNAFSGFRASSYANFSVRGNYFERNDKGITLMNTGAAGQEILCNTHQDDNWGIFASADCRGATFRKNKYDNKVADVLLQGINGISGQFPNQIFAANDASPFNYFSEHESDNDIVTEAPTNSFLYFPPFQNLVPIPAEIPRTLPDCDSDDFGCTMNYNFQNAPYVNGGFNCIINPLGDAPCIDRNCLDSLRSRLAWLQQQATLQEQYKSEMQGTERRFLSDKRVLLEQWFSDGNMTLIEQTLGTYGQVDDKQLLYGFYLRQKNLSQGAAVLASLPSNTTEDVWFKSVQNIYLNYLAASTTPYVATHAQDSLLETVGTSIQPVGANARAVYYLLHGIWLEPVIDAGDRQSIVKAEIPEAKTLLLIPNPANNKVRVRLPATDGTLRVFDLFGKLQQAITVSSIDMELDTVILNNGIYLLHYTALDGSHTQARLVIRH